MTTKKTTKPKATKPQQIPTKTIEVSLDEANIIAAALQLRDQQVGMSAQGRAQKMVAMGLIIKLEQAGLLPSEAPQAQKQEKPIEDEG